LRVAQQLIVERGRARLKPLPERDRRTVLLSPSLMQMLREHRQRQQAELAGHRARDGADLVFRAAGGEWLTPERFTRVMGKLIEQSGVPRITPNGLRRAGPLLAQRSSTDGVEYP
jgi:integrase